MHACEHFHYYAFGPEVEIRTDHTPMAVLIHKSFENISTRLQEMLLHRQRYTFNLTYMPAKQLIGADALARAPISSASVITTDIDNFQLTVSVVVQELQYHDEVTNTGRELQSVKKYILNG